MHETDSDRYADRCAARESGPVLYVRSSAQVVHVQYAFDTGIRTYGRS